MGGNGFFMAFSLGIIENSYHVRGVVYREKIMQEDLRAQLAETEQILGEVGQQLSKVFEQNKIDNLVDGLRKVASDISSLGTTFSKLDRDIGDWLARLAENGWYLDVMLASTKEIEWYSALFNKLPEDDANEKLIAYCDTKIDQIRPRIRVSYPERERIVAKALEAHSKGDYELSIPVLLTQIDGICYEELGAEFFRGFQELSEAVKTRLTSDPLLLAFCEPFLDGGGMIKWTGS